MVRSSKLACVLALLLCVAFYGHAQEAATGKIKTVDTTRNEVVLKGVVKDTVYELTKEGQVWLDGMRSKLGNLQTDDRAAITYEKKGDHLMARTVRALRNAQEATGTVKDVFMDKREVTLKGVVKNTTYQLDKGGTVWADGKQGTLKDIGEGDQVLVTYIQRGDHMMAQDVTVTKRR